MLKKLAVDLRYALAFTLISWTMDVIPKDAQGLALVALIRDWAAYAIETEAAQ